jgi:hypothetical protein
MSEPKLIAGWEVHPDTDQLWAHAYYLDSGRGPASRILKIWLNDGNLRWSPELTHAPMVVVQELLDTRRAPEAMLAEVAATSKLIAQTKIQIAERLEILAGNPMGNHQTEMVLRHEAERLRKEAAELLKSP